MAVDQLGGLEGKRVLVVGAGTMGEGVAVALHRAGAGEILVANRTAERGSELADRVGGVAIGFDRLGAAIGDADLVLTCTGAGEPILTVDFLADACDRRHGPLLIVDIAVPRDVEAAVTELPNVRILDLDDLRDWADRGRAHRMVEAERVREIVREEVERFAQQVTALQAAPLVTAMREHAENVRAAELERFTSRLAELDDAERDAVDALTRSIIAKLLHQPSLRLKEQAGTPQGERNAAAVVDLFDLG